MLLHRLLTAASAVAVAAAFMLFAITPASAGVVGGGGKPGPREPVESGLPFTLMAGDACDFAVTIEEVANNEFARTFPNGNILTTGRLVVRVINDETGESVVRNVSGPTLATTGPGGEQVFILSGSSISPVFEGNDSTGAVGKGLFVFHGPTVFTDFKLTDVSGTFENLCNTLAG